MLTRTTRVLAFLACVLTAPGAQRAAASTTRLAEAQDEALEALERGLKDSNPAARVAALQAHGPSSSTDAVTLLVRTLRDKDRDVRRAGIESLRFSPHARALEGLHRMAKTDRNLRDDPELHVALYKAIGQHGSTTSLPILSSKLLVQKYREVSIAGILSIGNIRSDESVETLVSLMRSAARHRVQAYMFALRLALVVLTGADEGLSQDRWGAWWNDNKSDLDVAPALPKLKQEDRRTWDAHWGIRRRSERAPRRHERGTGDPE